MPFPSPPIGAVTDMQTLSFVGVLHQQTHCTTPLHPVGVVTDR